MCNIVVERSSVAGPDAASSGSVSGSGVMRLGSWAPHTPGEGATCPHTSWGSHHLVTSTERLSKTESRALEYRSDPSGGRPLQSAVCEQRLSRYHVVAAAL